MDVYQISPSSQDNMLLLFQSQNVIFIEMFEYINNSWVSTYFDGMTKLNKTTLTISIVVTWFKRRFELEKL